jgi:hypothetical protein
MSFILLIIGIDVRILFKAVVQTAPIDVRYRILAEQYGTLKFTPGN